MAVDINTLKELLNDTTDGAWKAIDTKLFISKLTGRFDMYDIESRGDAAFIAYVKNHMQEIIDALEDCIDEEICMTEEVAPVNVRETIEDFLDKLARQRGEL